MTPAFDFSGKTVLVTGSSQNLGQAIARSFAANKATVIVHGPTGEETSAAREALQAEIPGAKLHAAPFDLGRPDEIDAAFARLGREGMEPDILVNNAAHLGLGKKAGFLEQDRAFFREVLEINFFGAFHCSQLAARAMKARRCGNIVNISSLAAERAIFGRSAYNSSKAALDGLSRAMAQELAASGIRVNSISPGYVWTPRWEKLSAEDCRRRRMNIPCGEPTAPEEIARTVMFLCSDAAPTLTGARIVIDGGLNLQQVPSDTSV